MTTLYDTIPFQKQEAKDYYLSESEEEEEEGNYELTEFDLDVVDDALLNPNSSEYLDHFGFTIQVKTDDEDSSDQDSDMSHDEEEQERKNHMDGSTTTATTITSDDDSIDTNLTTPHSHHQKWEQSIEIDTNNVPILKSPPSARNVDRISNRYSILSSFNMSFKNMTRPSSSIASSPTATVQRPSQTFQQRQSKRSSTTRLSTVNITSKPLTTKSKRMSHNDHQYDSENHLILKQEALAELNIYKESNTEYDWDFWSLVIQDFGQVIDSQMDDLRQHLVKGGIPSPIRGLLWQLIVKSQDHISEYKESIKKSSSFEKQIQRDITRTFPNHPYFMQESGRQALFNVAKAYSLFDQEVGYCQGLAFIIACLLLHMSEENTYCTLVKIMGKYGLRGHFTPRMELLNQHLYQFDNVFQQKLPVIHRHLESEGVTPSMYASQWFITLFSYRCPIEISFRVIDMLLIEGTQILIQIALGLIVRNQEKILKLKFESLIEFLCHGIFHVYEENADEFVQDIYKIELPAKFMSLLAQQYAESNTENSQEDNLRRINGQLSEHIRSVESQLQQLRVENKDITQQVITSKMEIAKNEDEKQQLRHELSKLKQEFEKYKKDTTQSYQDQINVIMADKRRLENENVLLANQLTDTEAMLIDLKMSFAERESDFETLKRQLKEAKK